MTKTDDEGTSPACLTKEQFNELEKYQDGGRTPFIGLLCARWVIRAYSYFFLKKPFLPVWTSDITVSILFDFSHASFISNSSQDRKIIISTAFRRLLFSCKFQKYLFRR